MLNSRGVYEDSFWQTVRYGVCEIHYGDRVTDELGRRLIKCIGENYFCNNRVFENIRVLTPRTRTGSSSTALSSRASRASTRFRPTARLSNST